MLTSWESSGRLDGGVLARAIGAFGDSGDFRTCVPGAAYDRALAFLSRASGAELLKARFFASGRPADRELAGMFDLALMSIEADEIEHHMKSTLRRGHFIPRIIELIGDSGSFADSARRVSYLELVADELRASDIDALRGAIENNSGDQVRPARDVEDILLTVAGVGVTGGEDMKIAWAALAEMMFSTTDPDRYYGSVDGAPYSRLLEFSKSSVLSAG